MTTTAARPEIRNGICAELLLDGLARSDKQRQIYLEGAYSALHRLVVEGGDCPIVRATLDFLREHLEEMGTEFVDPSELRQAGDPAGAAPDRGAARAEPTLAGRTNVATGGRAAATRRRRGGR